MFNHKLVKFLLLGLSFVILGLVGTNDVYIEEYNWNFGDGHYIHLNGTSVSCGGTDVVISNQTITNSLDCPASNSITINPDTTIQPSSGNTVRFYIQQ